MGKQLRGLAISVDGPNFVGKSTFCDALTANRFVDSPVQRERGVRNDSRLGRLIHDPSREFKADPIVNALLIAAEKRHAFHASIESAVRDGCHIIFDRHLVSCVAYGFLYAADVDFIYRLYDGFPRPDVQFVLMASIEELERRMKLRVALSHTEATFSRSVEADAYDRAITFMIERGEKLNVIRSDQALNKMLGEADTIIDKAYRAS